MFLALRFPSIKPSPNLSQLLLLSPSSHFFVSLSMKDSKSTTAKVGVVVEYAKSGRSSCKKCLKPIANGSLRLGSSFKNPSGFDMIKWHHLCCFSKESWTDVGDVEEIKGFSSLKDYDKEELIKLKVAVGSGDGASVEDSEDPNLHPEKVENKENAMRKAGETRTNQSTDSEETCLKKQKLSGTDNQPNTVFFISEVKAKYKDATLPPKWKAFQTIIFREKDDGLHDSTKIAAFDFDGCLANTSVKKIGSNAWSLLHPSIPEKLQSLYNDGYKLVIFTNESNIERWKNKRQQAIDSKVGRLDNFIKCVEVPMQVFIACGLGRNKDGTSDPFRKPNVGMWTIMKDHFNSGILIDMDQSFYVGDAAGRVNDHSDADIKFAEDIGLKFHLPEVYFKA
ncbi:hypothetical protein ZOSMA_375G00160 [Zostera marina]|uniref:PARP-type domain-containing protein n=1 Tax=Zostera marina TaxID=29655 RepID=A0A0K9P7V6_ZOSMR|nr:hypothetical protein ZOSMA_375G00160 [Zostera marina]